MRESGHNIETVMIESDGQSSSVPIDDGDGDYRGVVDDGPTVGGTADVKNRPGEGIISDDDSSNFIKIITKGDCVVEMKTTTPTLSDWSDALKSPTGIFVFSPSLDPSKPESLHGFGKKLPQHEKEEEDVVPTSSLLFLLMSLFWRVEPPFCTAFPLALVRVYLVVFFVVVVLSSDISSWKEETQRL
jgi:hypothetical protein